MKKIFFAMLACVLMFGAAKTVWASETNEAETEKHLIVLMDTSASMEGHDAAKKELQWVRDISAVCVNTEIRLTVIGFSKSGEEDAQGIRVLVNDEKVDNEKFRNLSDSLDEIVRNGEKTDQLEAIKEAKEVVDRTQAENCVIVMLSDGELDYVGRTKDYAPEKTEKEQEAEDEFREICKELAADGCRLFFVGFGTDIELFQGWEDGSDIQYFFRENDLTDVIHTVFETENEDISSEEGTLTDGEISFAWEERDEKVIVNIKSGEEELSDIQVFDEDGTVYDANCVNIANSVYLFISGLEQGNYRIRTDAASNVQYSLMRVKQYEYAALDITWEKADGEELNTESVIELESADFPLGVCVSADTEIDVKEFGWFLRAADGNEERGCMSWDGKETFEQSEVIHEPETSGDYEYGIYIQAVNGSAEQVETFRMIYRGEDDTEVTEAEQKVLKELCVDEELNISGVLKEEEISFSGDAIGIELAEGDGGSFEKNEDSLVVWFEKEGSYQLQITQNGEEILKVECCVREQRWWKKVWLWLVEHFQYIFGGK